MPSADACAITSRVREHPDGSSAVTDSRGTTTVSVPANLPHACPCGSGSIRVSGALGGAMTVRCAQCGTPLPATNASIAAAMGWPHGDPGAPEPTIDPRTAAEDRCRTFWESCTDFEKATLRWLASVNGWTDQRALDVRTREWRRGK